VAASKEVGGADTGRRVKAEDGDVDDDSDANESVVGTKGGGEQDSGGGSGDDGNEEEGVVEGTKDGGERARGGGGGGRDDSENGNRCGATEEKDVDGKGDAVGANVCVGEKRCERG
jgi:hypothetical protein